ncbi:MAG: NUDIX domain-containing protein [Candidatus Latescibacteria bacterium]|nr:NUDIX domain-containing protein [Candidatus Latescibacterota bacterium]
MRTKAFGLILRPTPAGTGLLALYFSDAPDMPLRLPGGNIDPGENPEQAMYREVREEAGLEDLTMVRKLGIHNYYKPFIQDDVERHDFLLRAPGNTPYTWVHTVSGEGGDAGSRFHYQWLVADQFHRLDDELNTFVTPEHIPELFAG